VSVGAKSRAVVQLMSSARAIGRLGVPWANRGARRFPAGEAAPAPRRAGDVLARGRETGRAGRRTARRREELGGSAGEGEGAPPPVHPREEPLDRLPRIDQGGKASDHLPRGRGTPRGPARLLGRAVAGDHRAAGVAHQPRGQGGGRAIPQPSDRPASLAIDQERAVGLAFGQGEGVDAHDARCRSRGGPRPPGGAQGGISNGGSRLAGLW
jgi:hypothetical protein